MRSRYTKRLSLSLREGGGSLALRVSPQLWEALLAMPRVVDRYRRHTPHVKYEPFMLHQAPLLARYVLEGYLNAPLTREQVETVWPAHRSKGIRRVLRQCCGLPDESKPESRESQAVHRVAFELNHEAWTDLVETAVQAQMPPADYARYLVETLLAVQD